MFTYKCKVTVLSHQIGECYVLTRALGSSKVLLLNTLYSQSLFSIAIMMEIMISKEIIVVIMCISVK